MDQEKEPLVEFKPLTPGLGFHPFSNGLPYAPRTSPRSSGSNATTAGPPTFPPGTLTSRTTPQPVPPQPPQVVPRGSFVPSPRSIQEKSLFQPLSMEKTELFLEPEYSFGYLLRRVLAYFTDAIVNILLCGGALSAILVKQQIQPDLFWNTGVIFLSALFFGFFNWALVTAQEVIFGTSLGKKLFHLALPGDTWAVFMRALLFLPSFIFLMGGIFWAVLDSKKRCWHDLASGLQPIETSRA